VGAGLGLTTERLRRAGWQVTALEPEPVLRRCHEGDAGVEVLAHALQDLPPRPAYDAVVAESVLYSFDPSQAAALVRARLRPGGALYLVEMVWTAQADSSEVCALHDDSARRFGIAVASRRPWTWDHWRAALRAEGLEAVHEERLGTGSTGGPSRPSRRALARNSLAHPRAATTWARMNTQARDFRIPKGWTESWASLWRAVEIPTPRHDSSGAQGVVQLS